MEVNDNMIKATSNYKIDPKEEIQIGNKKNSERYEKAFLSRDEKNTSEFTGNTASWD